MPTLASALFLFASAASAAGAADATGTLVLVVGRGDAFDSTPGDELRRALAKSECGADVLDDTATAARLSGGYVAPPAARAQRLASQRADAEARFNDFDLEGAQAAYRDIITTLADEPNVSADERAVLQSARIGLAVSTLAAAPREESGRGETTVGQQARDALANAIRTDPTLSLDANTYPPKVRKLFESARAATQADGLGGLEVVSQPAGVTVVIEGRPLGQTPLKLLQALPHGRYRMWLQHRGRRTPARFIEVSAGQPTRIDIDADLDITLWPLGRGLWPQPNAPIPPAFVERVKARARAGRVLIVGDFITNDIQMRYVGIVGAKGVRRGGFKPGPDVTKRIVRFVCDDDAPSDMPAPVFVLPAAHDAAHAAPTVGGGADETHAESEAEASAWGLYAGIGVGAAAVLVIAAAALVGGATGLFFYLNRPVTGATFDVVVTE